MIRSKQGKIKNPHNHPLRSSSACVQPKQFDAVLKNYKCLFCRTTYYFDNIYNAKCSCGSQWFEKLQAVHARQLDCV